MESKYDVIVVGGAAAGLTAALYMARQGLKTLVITKDIGGQALLTTEIQNYPGFKSIGGFELMSIFQEQASLYGTEFFYDEVVSVSGEDRFTVKTTTASFEAEALILAFGKTPRDLNVPGESELKGRGVSYCAVCDGPLYRGKEVILVGHGDHALQAALYLSGVASGVTVVQRPNTVRGDPELLQALKSRNNVRFRTGCEVRSIEGDATVRGVTAVCGGKEERIEGEAVFVEMGYVTRSKFLEGFVEMNDEGEIIVDSLGQTSRKGVFAAGDITQMPYKQVVISAGQGATAALSAYNYLQKKRGKHASNTDWRTVDIKVTG